MAIPMDMSKQWFLLCACGAVLAAQSIASPVTSVGSPGYEPFSARDRLHWALSRAISPANLIAGALVAGRATWTNSPEEYGTHWDGFGKRYGTRLAGGATGNLMEAGIGSIWGEDPRYFRTSGKTIKYRLGNVFRMTFVTHNPVGGEMPAYARYLSIPATTLLSNAWRPDSQTQMADAAGRIAFGVLSHVIGNAFSEFKPDLVKRFSRRKNVPAGNDLSVRHAEGPYVK